MAGVFPRIHFMLIQVQLTKKNLSCAVLLNLSRSLVNNLISCIHKQCQLIFHLSGSGTAKKHAKRSAAMKMYNKIQSLPPDAEPRVDTENVRYDIL